MEEEATIEGQFEVFAKFMKPKTRDGTTVNLHRSDFWLRQARILEDRQLTMTDTGIIWFRSDKTELTLPEWLKYLSDLCACKNLDYEYVVSMLVNCGDPSPTGEEPHYRDFFRTYKPKSRQEL